MKGLVSTIDILPQKWAKAHVRQNFSLKFVLSPVKH